MSDVAIYHPGTGAQASAPEEAMPHLRQSGWLLLSEHQGNQSSAAEASKPSTSKKGDQ